MSIRLISLNIERDKHLGLAVPFLEKEPADVVILYELLESDISVFESALGARCFFVPTTRYPAERGPTVEGSAFFTKLPAEFSVAQYAGNPGDIADFAEHSTPAEKALTQKYLLAGADVQKGDEKTRILMTHFPWTPDGQADDIQRKSADSLMALLDQEDEFVLCGDFNAPRGREIFSRFAARYADNIPASYGTSLDGAIHRAGPLPYVVDVLFSTPGYAVSDVELRFGVSDHAAVIGTVSRA